MLRDCGPWAGGHRKKFFVLGVMSSRPEIVYDLTRFARFENEREYTPRSDVLVSQGTLGDRLHTATAHPKMGWLAIWSVDSGCIVNIAQRVSLRNSQEPVACSRY